jgi:hypothetical protein
LNDGTREFVAEEIHPLADRVIYHGKNLGEGAGLRSGFKAGSGGVVVVQDGNMDYVPNGLPRR